MSKMNTKIKTIDEYIAGFPKPIQKLLNETRATIRDAAPKAEEDIRYGMPTFRINEKNLVHFAAFKNHIGFYPSPSGITNFEKELTPYKHAKGSIQFPLDTPLPFKLITKIVKYRVKENNAKIKTDYHK